MDYGAGRTGRPPATEVGILAVVYTLDVKGRHSLWDEAGGQLEDEFWHAAR